MEGVSGDHAAADRLAPGAHSGSHQAGLKNCGLDGVLTRSKTQNPNSKTHITVSGLGVGVWDLGFGIYFLAVSAGVGRSEYDVRDHTFTPARFVVTSIRRVRRSGSGLLE